MALDTSRRNGRGGMLLTRRSSYGGGGTASAARHDEAARWLADHADELAAPVIDRPAITFEAAQWWHDEDIRERLTDEARGYAADAAREAIADMLDDPDLPGWGDHFDPADVQWGFTVSTRPPGGICS